jgi:hypothetical protein
MGDAPSDGTFYGRLNAAWVNPPPAGREKLTAARTYYVRTDGNDSNTGLDINLQAVTIYVADGTYTDQVNIPNLIGGCTCTVIGNQITPANVLLSVNNASPINCNQVVIATKLMFSYLKIVSSGTAPASIYHKGLGTINISHIDFGAAGTHMFAQGAGAMIFSDQDAHTISGGSGQHYLTQEQGSIVVTSCAYTLTGTPNISGAFAWANRMSLINCAGNTYSGSATGKRYNIQNNSICYSLTTLPGNVAGTTATGGIYS